ncbi:MAG: HlyC/CorC family transporter [Bryobacteraceae bacterium]|nr:HlyC/CorC family transporter [Bryobacteraceae bacterium]
MEIVVIVLLIGANGFLSMAELAVVSSRKLRLEQKAEAGDQKAAAALELARNPSDFLSTIQVGITLVGTLAGAFGGVTIAVTLGRWLQAIPPIAPYADSIAFGVVVVTISYFTLIFGELVPKNIALAGPEQIAAVLGPTMRGISRVAAPGVRFLSWSTHLMLRLLGIRHGKDSAVSEAEIRALIEQGTVQGTFEEAEQELVEGVFRLGDRRVVDLMRPRMKVVWLDPDWPAERIKSTITQTRYSRFPVCRGSLDDLLGVVHVKDILMGVLDGKRPDVVAAMKQPVFVPERKPALGALESFQTTGQQFAVVIDEHGGIQGIITLSDIFEAVTGDWLSPGSDRPRMTQREDGSWLVDGFFSILNLKEELELPKLPGEDEVEFATVAGFVMAALKRVPAAGDTVAFEGWRFEVVDMDGSRVDKVLVSKVPAPVT